MASTWLRKFASTKTDPAPLTLSLSKGPDAIGMVRQAHHERLSLALFFARKY
jgi:hypothetical protein